MAESDDDKKVRFLRWSYTPGGWGLVALAGVSLTMIVNGIILWCFRSPQTGITASDFGAIFGFSSALFTGLAFAGLIVANLQQRQEIDTAREALKQARKELKIAQENQGELKDQIDKQNKFAERKSFEDSLFKLLEQLDSCRARVRKDRVYSPRQDGTHNIGITRVEGVEFFVSLMDECNNFCMSKREWKQEFLIIEEISNAIRRNIIHFSFYLDLVDSIIEFINASQSDDKGFYSKLIGSIVSNSEIGILILNSQNGTKRPSADNLKKFGLYDLAVSRNVFADYRGIDMELK